MVIKYNLNDIILVKIFSLQISKRESRLERMAEIGAPWGKMNNGGGWLGSLCSSAWASIQKTTARMT